LLSCLSCAQAQVAAAPQTTDRRAQAPEGHREIIRRHLELINRGEWRQAADYFSEDVQHYRGSWPGGTETIVKGMKVLADNLEDIFRTFPDWRMEIVEMAVDGESVVVRCRVSGTHKGVATRPVNGALLMNVQPTGRRFEVHHIHWYKIHDGKITHHSTNRDDLGMLQQLGVVPVPK
jgi:steroid delta-isomerase-like uncharacterized protein